jgi:succinate dehydrogenase/fumarate reductase cytochrome b subunit
MSIVTLGFVVAAISAADLLAEFLKLTLTMILSPDAKTSLSATDEELYNTMSSAAGPVWTVLCCLLFFLAFFGLLPEVATPALPA